jgi:branched-chain amino acid aminotransferase
VTPRHGILPGITRSIVIELAKEFYDVETRDVHRSELIEFDEVFITASNKEVVPIVQVDDLLIGSGRVGEHTRKIMQLFRSYTDTYGQGRSGLALPAASLAAELA